MARVSTQNEATTRGYSVTHAWERSSLLEEEELNVLQELSRASIPRPEPKHVREDEDQEETDGPNTEENHRGGSPGIGEVDALHDAQQFYRWFSELEVARATETEGKYKEYAAILQGYSKSCEDIIQNERNAKKRLESLEAQHKLVTETIRGIHDACETLVKDRMRLAYYMRAISDKLAYFDDLEEVAQKLQVTNVDVESESFLSMVKKLDECVTFIGEHPQYMDSAAYVARFRHLQFRTLSAVRSYVANGLKRAKQQVFEVLSKNGNLVVADGSETSLLYVRFKASAPELKSTMEEMEHRVDLPEYSKLVIDCLSYYFDTRLTLIRPTVKERIQGFSGGEYLPPLLRQGLSYLVQICQLEYQLFQYFFPKSAEDPMNILPLIEPVFAIMYDVARPRLVHVNDVDTLCELVEIVRGEILEDQIIRRGKLLACLRPLTESILSDIQERLTYRAQAYIKEEISAFIPTLGDLDYPNCLSRKTCEEAVENAQVVEASGTEVEHGLTSEEAEDVGSNEIIYPAVILTVEFIPKIYYSLGSNTFSGLAQETVEACILSIDVASRKILQTASMLDSLLFQIRHLLILREQLAPFEASFSFVDKELDFSHTKDQLQRILNGESSLFTLSSSNAMFQLMARSAPSVKETERDSKRELENRLKAVCETFIVTVTKQVVEPILSFVTKVAAIRAAGYTRNRPLHTQAFASTEKLSTAVAKSQDALTLQLDDMVGSTKTYLPNASTRSVLFRPVKSNIEEAFRQVRDLLESDYNDVDTRHISLFSTEQLAEKLLVLG